MKYSKIKEMSRQEIKAKEAELRKELLKFRFESAVTQVKNPLKKRSLRKDIARLLTAAREKKNAGK
ncbi:MAG: 50S ribosomal protein L29 [Candidatus Margulisiibacteriota bacterium]